MNERKTMCRIPVRATMQRINGKIVMVDAQWEDVPVEAIARLLFEKFGFDTKAIRR